VKASSICKLCEPVGGVKDSFGNNKEEVPITFQVMCELHSEA
jgi:hypothetical protein